MWSAPICPTGNRDSNKNQSRSDSCLFWKFMGWIILVNGHNVLLHTQTDPGIKLENGDKKLFPPSSWLGQSKESARAPPSARIWNCLTHPKQFRFKMCSLEAWNQAFCSRVHIFFKHYTTASLKPVLKTSPALPHFIPWTVSIAWQNSHPCTL